MQINKPAQDRRYGKAKVVSKKRGRNQIQDSSETGQNLVNDMNRKANITHIHQNQH